MNTHTVQIPVNADRLVQYKEIVKSLGCKSVEDYILNCSYTGGDLRNTTGATVTYVKDCPNFRYRPFKWITQTLKDGESYLELNFDEIYLKKNTDLKPEQLAGIYDRLVALQIRDEDTGTPVELRLQLHIKNTVSTYSGSLFRMIGNSQASSLFKDYSKKEPESKTKEQEQSNPTKGEDWL
jgi:hypothetical protein